MALATIPLLRRAGRPHPWIHCCSIVNGNGFPHLSAYDT